MVSVAAIVTLVLSAAAGAVLFFVAFAAVFNGLWPVLLLVIGSYSVAGAVAVSATRTRPLFVACALVAPALPWLAWLFPASIPEAGLLRASLWPLAVGIAFLLAWGGGLVAARVFRRNALP